MAVPGVLLLGKKKYVTTPPRGSVLLEVGKTLGDSGTSFEMIIDFPSHWYGTWSSVVNQPGEDHPEYQESRLLGPCETQ